MSLWGKRTNSSSKKSSSLAISALARFSADSNAVASGSLVFSENHNWAKHSRVASVSEKVSSSLRRLKKSELEIVCTKRLRQEASFFACSLLCTIWLSPHLRDFSGARSDRSQDSCANIP